MRTQHALIVEDEMITAMELEETVKSIGYKVDKIIASGDEAVTQFRTQRPDFVLLDIVIKGEMDGIQVAECIREESDIPIIYITAYSDDELLHRAQQTKPIAYLIKPITPKQVVSTLRVVLPPLSDRKNAGGKLLGLEDRLDGLFEAISQMVEIKNPLIAGHHKRVAALACAIASELGLSPEQIDAIEKGTYIHAAGLVGVPYHILSKKRANLSLQEQLKFKRYPRIGYEIFKDVSFNWPLADIVLHHQEKPDGSGFPDGLQGEEISLMAKIVGIACRFDAAAFGLYSGSPLECPDIQGALQATRQEQESQDDSSVTDVCVRLIMNGKIAAYRNYSS